MKAVIISNNVDIEDLLPSAFSFLLLDGSAKDVLTAARDRIHLGAKLLAHPMAGRLRPNETPYMTVVLDDSRGELDLPSFEIIEYCLAEEEKYAPMRKKYDETLLPDLRFINCELFQSILEELK
ncbi:MAG: GrdX family protein [Firmicutes bacterium]|nr:GrdX family protein [Bacillota bacterium]